MAIKPFNGVEPSMIVSALQRDCDSEQIVSIMFRAVVPPVRSVNEREQWLRLKGILGCPDVYNAFGLSSLPIDPPATFNYSQELETIGTLANMLMHGGVHARFVDGRDSALSLSREFLDAALLGQYQSTEAYSCRDAWCEWFIGEGILDETVLIGNRGECFLIAVTGTDCHPESTQNKAMHTKPPFARFANGERVSGGSVIASVRPPEHYEATAAYRRHSTGARRPRAVSTPGP